jgi:DNA-directed RNA polymerase II subunit RPB2
MSITGDTAREMARLLIDRYFRTNLYPYTKHHIDSYDQFLKTDLISTLKAMNPFIILKDIIDETRNLYKYKIEIFIGGVNGDRLEIGTPTVNLQNGKDIRLLFPNEARLRNLTYAASVYADIDVHITYTADKTIPTSTPEIVNLTGIELFKIPIMLHSSYCILHNKPKEFLRIAGECTQDNGGYFVVDGSEKILVTQQEQAFNTLYISKQKSSTKPNYLYATIACLNQQSRTTKRVAFGISRKTEDHNCIVVSLPMVRKAVPLFILFRALGFQTDKEIIQCIFPDIESTEAKLLMPYLYESIRQAESVHNTSLAIQYIKIFTKGFSEIHVLDIIRNQLFIHMPNDTTRQALFLGDCVRRILRVHAGFDEPTDRDDTQNQRCHVSGFLIQMLFNNIYANWKKKVSYAIDLEYNKNVSIYDNNQFKNMFVPEKLSSIFALDYMTESIMRGFKGKWAVGYGEEKAGVLQQLSRLSYCDFMSHCRRLTLDTGGDTEIIGPHKLHPSQYGYFCTNETPSGKSIGITKNLTIMATFSIHSDPTPLMNWLKTRGRVYDPEILNSDQKIAYVPLYINNGLFGYTAKPQLITQVLRAFKRAGCLPYSTSITFSIKKRRVQIFVDQGRPVRPLIHLTDENVPVDKIKSLKTWRDLVMGTIPERANADLSSTDFMDPFEADNIPLEGYYDKLLPYIGVLEYIDPYEQNEAYIANYPEYIRPETTHMEIHPSTILSLMTGVIPFPHHNQSPRNQLSCSQSKQGVSIYATNWKNRFDNNTHVLCYGEAPLSRSLYSNYMGEGKMPYGMNCVLAIACWSGYNQEDGIVMNKDAVERGMFRNITYRSYEAFEEDDKMTRTKKRFANPAKIQGWKDLRPGLDYSKLDAHGIIREGELIDENTVIVGAFTTTETGQIIDSSISPQVWTSGRVDKVVQMVSNQGLRLIKIRVVTDRIPELGDKFCLTPDHEVLTERGWINIDNVTSEDKIMQYNPITQISEFVKPSEIYEFENDNEDIVIFESDIGKLEVTPGHRLYASYTNDINKLELILASNIDVPVYMLNDNMKMIKYISTKKIKRTCKVYCYSVPTEIFLVRYKNMEAVWTGNSNRHGQKGTIGALLRGHDMPRTAEGIVPDMIMNPHAIPSRMTIGQNLEQLLGKAAAAAGAIGDATAFMNDGSPEEYIGALLEARGFEKYGNEIMYNGATGEQLMGSIFVGPVYGMRLKHMVQDKLQARGKGRKEQKTHQPTGGRSNQGGLKIGEMDRDAIAGHGVASFFRESFMDRSDGEKFPICTGCGTFPIYNPKLGIAICSLCDGPVKFAGDTVHNMEILPPLSKPKSKIVEIEMPYATKLLNNELETYLNMSLRYITTSGVQRLRPFELTAEGTAALRELRPLELPDTFVPEYIEKDPAETVTTDELAALETRLNSLEEEQPTMSLDVIQEMGETGVIGEPGSELPPLEPSGIPSMNGEEEMEGGFTAPLDTAFTSPIPSGPKIIAVDTSAGAMADEGLGMNPFAPAMGGRRTLRRAPAFGGQPQQMYGGESTTDPETGTPIILRKTAPVTVNKLG